MRIPAIIGLVILVAMNVRGFRPGIGGSGAIPLKVDEYIGFPMTYLINLRESTDAASGNQIVKRLVATIPFHSYTGLPVSRRIFMPGALLIDLGVFLLVSGVVLKLFYQNAW